uniref:P/Homo B domain-containing protein n=1 Tax=Knipowitschia caucasica TaxID=637954 RepID=A0AAV2IT88_KNICA
MAFWYLHGGSPSHQIEEGQVVRTWKVGDPPEERPQTPTPPPSTPLQQDSPQAVRPPVCKKNRKKCFCSRLRAASEPPQSRPQSRLRAASEPPSEPPQSRLRAALRAASEPPQSRLRAASEPDPASFITTPLLYQAPRGLHITLRQCCRQVAALKPTDFGIALSGLCWDQDQVARSKPTGVGDLMTYYSFWHNASEKRSTRPNHGLTAAVSKETKVKWLQQQIVWERAASASGAGRIYSAKHFSSSLHLPSNQTTPLHFNDPTWNRLWFVYCSDGASGCRSLMNIAAAWERGYTGKGVVVSVLSDGVEGAHSDLRPNYDPLASSITNTNKQKDGVTNSRGTQCAGIIAAAAAPKSRCTVGVSFRARIGGIDMLSADVTDSVEARSLSFKPHYVDIYLCTWGPADDGKTVEGPGPLAKLAMQRGVKRGRRGLGSIFVWTSGSGGRSGDHCSCDGYSSSIYTVSISSASWSGAQPGFQERCASILAAAYAGDESGTLRTAGDGQTCAEPRPAPALAASVATGVIALTLEANPALTWRDVQHIIVRSSSPERLRASDWTTNGAGRRVSHVFGFGLMDAETMVREAERWEQVPPQHVCVEEPPVQQTRSIYPGSTVASVREASGCAGSSVKRVAYVEHVVVRVTVTHQRRGDLSVRLRSPSATVSELLAPRYRPPGSVLQGASSRERPPGSGLQGAASRGRPPGGVLQGASSRGRPPGSGLQGAASRERPPGSGLQGAASRERPPGGVLQGASSRGRPPGGVLQGASSRGRPPGGVLQGASSRGRPPGGVLQGASSRGRPPGGVLQGAASRERPPGSVLQGAASRGRPPGGVLQGAASRGRPPGGDLQGASSRGRPPGGVLQGASSRGRPPGGVPQGAASRERPPGSGPQGAAPRERPPGSGPQGAAPRERPPGSGPQGAAPRERPPGSGYLPLDNSSEGFQSWELMTTHCWGEAAAGTWTLEVTDTSAKSRSDSGPGALVKWSLVLYGTAESPYESQRRRRAVASVENEPVEEYSGPCDAECTSDGCEGPGPQQCFTCSHLFLKFKNSTRLCVSECPRGFWGDRRRCKKCFGTCESCTGSRSDQCTSCQPGHFLTEGLGTCTAVCAEGFYLDHDANMCQKCSENCLKCTSFNICTECKQDTSLQGNQCLLSCAAGFYHDKQDDSCRPCHAACASCAGPGVESCKLCAEGFLMEEWRCVHSCSAGFYATEPGLDGQRTCRRCDSRCSLCVGPGADNCSRCSSGHSHLGGVCVLSSQCGDGEYADSDGNCRVCDATCVKCTGPEGGHCISCDSAR